MTNHPEGLSRLLEHATFELMPMKTTLEKARALPAGTRVSVTASPGKDMTATVKLCEDLVELGLEAVPHLSARMTKSHAELREIVRRLSALGTTEAFIVGGDSDRPGDFFDAMDLIRALDDLGMPFRHLGVTGYPEGHPHIADSLLDEALSDKAPYADHVVTQMCFDTEAIERWIRSIRDRGIDLPVVIGIPGVTDIAKLMGISTRIGVGTSIRFLSSHRSLATRLLRPFAPGDLIERLAQLAEDPDLDVIGLHVFTFNQVEATHGWFAETQRGVA